MKRHHLKTWPLCYAAIIEGRKTFEIRRNDRDFKVGDDLVLAEWDPDRGYTSRVAVRQVIFMTDFEQKPGFVVMGLACD